MGISGKSYLINNRSVPLAALLIFVCTVNSFAQSRGNIWVRATVGYPFSERLSADAEFQHRRQAGPDTDSPVAYRLLSSFRSWAHVRLTERLKLSVSPFAYLTHYQVNEALENQSHSSHDEMRFAAALLWQKPIGSGFWFVNRAAAEHRLFIDRPGDVLRLRDRAELQYGAGERFSVLVYNELLVNATYSPERIFDHNRIGLQFGYAYADYGIRVGYLFIHRPLRSRGAWLGENNISLEFVYKVRSIRKTRENVTRVTERPKKNQELYGIGNTETEFPEIQ